MNFREDVIKHVEFNLNNITMKKLTIASILIFMSALSCKNETVITQGLKPNILFIFIDDMGYGDLGVYGNKEVKSPNIDKLAQEGLRFNQFYVNSPICSPSRVAVTTGQFPSKWGITSYISDRKSNSERGMKDYLDVNAHSVARQLKGVGYYTAHIGKWHMGGGRDISDAPLITAYGFDESVTQFEGLGERYLATYETFDYPNGIRDLEEQSASLGKGKIHWEKRENFTKVFVDRTIKAIENAQNNNKPFYINLWPDDIHTPLEPPVELRGDLSTKARFLGVMQEMDSQMGRLFDYIRNNPRIASNTLIIFTSDNGPDGKVNKAAHLRGTKVWLYDGGIKEPFIAWWPGKIPQGAVNNKTVLSGIDLPLIFMDIAGAIPDENIVYDGVNMTDAILGIKESIRDKPLFWIRPPDRPGYNGVDNPDIAIRKGDYKLLMNVDSTDIQLYNIKEDESEVNNLALSNPLKVEELKEEIMEWYNNYPHSINKTIY
jgi:arylsulfatase A-like enzyme